jgi:hypothetical protein
MRAREEVELASIHRAVGARDREQRGKYVLEHAAIVGEGLAQLCRVSLETLGAVARLVEQTADVTHRLGRNAELALECVDLLALHQAVALGELGRQHDHADREELIAAVEHRGEARGVPSDLGPELRAEVRHGASVRRVTQRRPDHRAHRPAHGETSHAADDLAPVAHRPPLPRRG